MCFEDGKPGFPGKLAAYVYASRSPIPGQESMFARPVTVQDVCYDEGFYEVMMLV